MAFKDVVVIGQYIPPIVCFIERWLKRRCNDTFLHHWSFHFSVFCSFSCAVRYSGFAHILSNVPLRFYARSAKTVFILALFTFVFNALLTGQEVLFD